MNAKFHFWNTLNDVLEQTIQRKTGQVGALGKVETVGCRRRGISSWRNNRGGRLRRCSQSLRQSHSLYRMADRLGGYKAEHCRCARKRKLSEGCPSCSARAGLPGRLLRSVQSRRTTARNRACLTCWEINERGSENAINKGFRFVLHFFYLCRLPRGYGTATGCKDCGALCWCRSLLWSNDSTTLR